MKRFSRLISRIIEYPQIIFARARGIYWNHLYSCLLAEDLLGKVKPRTIIDVGSNKGDFIRACKYAFPKSIIYAFEPLKSQYGNNIKKIAGIKSFNFGLWNKDSQAILFKNLQYDGASSFLKPTEDYHLCLGKAEKIVEEKSIQKRFDSLNLPIERPCFLKVDVEGAEERVLRGFGNRLNEIDILQLELSFKDYFKKQTNIINVFKILRDYGFFGFLQIEVHESKNLPDVCDLIFFKNRVRNSRNGKSTTNLN